jgi:hypothetical protein
MLTRQKIKSIKIKADKARKEHEIKERNDFEQVYKYVKYDPDFNEKFQADIAHGFFSGSVCFHIDFCIDVADIAFNMPFETLRELLKRAIGKRLRELDFVDVNQAQNGWNENPIVKDVEKKSKWFESKKINLTAYVQYHN